MSKPDDRALEDFLAGRSEVSRAYRADTDKCVAPDGLDAGVLAQAAAPMARARRMQRWRVPLTMAASLVLVVGVLRLALEDPAARKQVFGPVVPAAPAASAEADDEPGQARAKSANAVPDYEADKRDLEMSRRSAAADATRQRESRSAAAPAMQESMNAAESSATPPSDRAVAHEAPGGVVARGASSAQMEATADALSPIVPLSKAAKTAPSSAPLQQSTGAVSAEPHALSVAPMASGLALRKERVVDGWQAGTYQGLRLGHATLDDIGRRWGAPAFADQTRTDQPLPDGRASHRLLQYPDRVDPRGPVKLYFDTNSQALASVTVTLKPSLPLKTIEAQERLSPPGLVRAADTPLCSVVTSPLAVNAPYPQYRVYPAQGIYVLLTAPEEVAEIDYFDVCH